MAPFSKPETVLKQAEGLVSVGQSHAALQSLTEMFSSKKFRSTPLASLEPIMHRFIELCVDMRKGRTAKEGLMQYKNIAQNTSVQSIENVITRFVQLADAKVKEAQEKAAVKVALDVDDLEASETPESILLGAVSGDQSKDRTDRALVTPWLKFLWESYRTSLETLKNNARLEVIYQQIAQQAFKFCLKHQRKVEFRRLCETLRLHLSNVAKYASQPHSINLSDPDTLQHHLDTRFAQLNTSVELELWQEAFRSVEDVHNLLTMAKKAPRPAMMANYYEKLTKIFLMSGNALYHAAAWGRYYAVVIGIGGKSEEEMSRLAGQVLVSALAVPVGLHYEDSEELKGRNARLSALLGLTKMPTRAGLLKDALSRGILKLSPGPIKSLYNILEVTFDPLTLCSSIAPLFRSLASDASYAPYLPLLQRALLSRLLSQLSQVYSTIKIGQLHELIRPLRDLHDQTSDTRTDDTPALPEKTTYSEDQVEAYIMGCARRGELAIRVDHATGSITFIDDPFLSHADEAAPPSPSSTPREKTVQPSSAELVRTRLSSLATTLCTALDTLSPSASTSTSGQQQDALTTLIHAAAAERKALSLRRALVHRRRELLSELAVRKEKEEQSKQAELSRRRAEEESRRVREDLRRRELERARREVQEIKAGEARKLAQVMVERGQLRGVDVERMETLDQENLISLQVAQIEKERRDTADRVRLIGKRIDHLERAYRKAERPLLAQDYASQQTRDRETFEAMQAARRAQAQLAHDGDIAAKRRLVRMVGDYGRWREVMVQRKGEEYAKRRETAQRRIEEEKAKRRRAVLQAQEEEKKRREEEEQKRREEEEELARQEAARAEEERKRREAEEAAAAEAEARRLEEEARVQEARRKREEERAAANEAARLQRQREEEAEARRAARAAEKKAQETSSRRPAMGPSTVPNSQAPKANGTETWRKPGLPTPTGTAPPTPTRASATAPPRAESPSPAAPVAKYRPGALGGGGGGWRTRGEAKAAAANAHANANPSAPAARSSRPATPAQEESQVDDDGFQKVSEKRGVWRPRRGRA